jgi:hypothetical protein
VRLSAIILSALVTASALAQTSQQNWVPQAIENLGQNASSRTEFTLDHSMLVLAAKQDQDDEGLRRVIAGVDGISVHRFRFPGTGMYDPGILNSVRQQYRTGGWQHIAAVHDKNGGPGATDLWLHFENNVIRNVAVLFAGRDQVNFVAVSGSISPIDLLHLGGHFGIPKINGGVVVPGPGGASVPPLGNAAPPGSGEQQSSAPEPTN